jgi:hypothetical protein
MRLPISLNDVKKATHDYDVYVVMPQELSFKGREAIITVYARNRNQAAAIARREGYTVNSVNMVG